VETWEPTWPGRPPGAGSLGQRIAALRADRSWTQQQLADRLGISRVAVSHLETDINTPGERTVALLAGLFRCEPHDLVAGTSYPVAKADRLPLVVARWTEVEHQLALLDRDIRWLEGADRSVAEKILSSWAADLAALAEHVHDADEQRRLASAQRRLSDLRARD
jgi:transcriptional regulator with XRE-family HTH domain